MMCIPAMPHQHSTGIDVVYVFSRCRQSCIAPFLADNTCIHFYWAPCDVAYLSLQLGMALNVYNDLTVRTDVDKFIMTIEGEGAGG